MKLQLGKNTSLTWWSKGYNVVIWYFYIDDSYYFISDNFFQCYVKNAEYKRRMEKCTGVVVKTINMSKQSIK